MQLADAMRKAGIIKDKDYEAVVREKTKKMLKEIDERHFKKDKDVQVEDFEVEDAK